MCNFIDKKMMNEIVIIVLKLGQCKSYCILCRSHFSEWAFQRFFFVSALTRKMYSVQPKDLYEKCLCIHWKENMMKKIWTVEYRKCVILANVIGFIVQPTIVSECEMWMEKLSFSHFKLLSATACFKQKVVYGSFLSGR